MKLKFLLLAGLAVAGLTAGAHTLDKDSVYIDSVVINLQQSDSTEVIVKFNETTEYAALGFDVNLPEDTTLFQFGVFPGRRGAVSEYIAYDPDERFADHTHAFLYHNGNIEDGKLRNFTRVLIYSGTNSMIYTGNGPIGKMIVKYKGAAPAKETVYYGYINNANASNGKKNGMDGYFYANGSTNGKDFVKFWGKGLRFPIIVRPQTGVDDLTADKAVSSVKYYNLQGMESAQPFDGVNIVVKTYTDGSKSAAKQVIR